MRRLTVLLLMALAVGLALLAWPLVWGCCTLRRQADRLRQGRAGPQLPDAVVWAAIRRHEQDVAAGRARWQ